jgi:hypothetical protein
MSEETCDHRNRNIRFEKDGLVHTCRICHETWIEPRMGSE